MVLSDQEREIIFVWLSTCLSEYLKSVSSQSEESLEHMGQQLLDQLVLLNGERYSAGVDRSLNQTRLLLIPRNDKGVQDEFRTIPELNFRVRLSLNLLRRQESKAERSV